MTYTKNFRFDQRFSDRIRKGRAVIKRSRVDCVRQSIFKPMFIEANNKDEHRILINTDAIAYVDFDAVVYTENYPNELKQSGVRISFQVSRGDQEGTWPAFQDFVGKEAENLRAGLSKALGANRFS